MSGLSVYQDTPDNLKALQYGYDGTSAKVLRLDTVGRQLVTTDTGDALNVEATDLDIRNLSNTQDNILVYGNDGTANKVVKTDTSGRVVVTNDAGQTVEVSATDLDIRNLSNTQDNIVVYGNDGSQNRVLLTDSSGYLQTRTSKTFTNQTENVTTTDTYTGATARDISLQSSLTFFVNNTGSNPANVKVQISPDNTLWIDDSSEFTIAASEAKAYSTNKFANHARVTLKSANAGSATQVTVIYQAQS
ncbi:MAG: DUF6385 domain-containing protein [Clostridia bacterium]|nr:DUF6385 domain-containing protein [Clostridia bacterium]